MAQHKTYEKRSRARVNDIQMRCKQYSRAETAALCEIVVPCFNVSETLYSDSINTTGTIVQAITTLQAVTDYHTAETFRGGTSS